MVGKGPWDQLIDLKDFERKKIKNLILKDYVIIRLAYLSELADGFMQLSCIERY